MKIAKRFLITLIVCLSVILLAGLLSFFISRPHGIIASSTPGIAIREP